MKKTKWVASMLLVFGALFAGGQKSATTRASLDELASMPWGQLVKVAQGEGEVNWFVWYFQPRYRQLAQDFTDKYGIKVTIPEGTLNGNVNKAVAERNLEVGSIDVLAIDVGSWLVIERADMAYGPLNFLPDYQNLVTELAGVNSHDHALAYWGNQTGFAYDSSRIKEEELPQTFEQLTAWIRQNPHEFGFADVRGGGSGTAFITSVLRQVDRSGIDYKAKVESYERANRGNKQPPPFFDANNPEPQWTELWDWLNQNKPYYTVTKTNADSLTRLNDGEFRIVAAWEDHLFSLQEQGAISRKLRFYVPKMGMHGGGNMAAVMRNSAHPAASLLFLSWLTSAEIQTRLMQEFGSVPQNHAVSGNLGERHTIVELPREYKLLIKKDFIAKVLLE